MFGLKEEMHSQQWNENLWQQVDNSNNAETRFFSFFQIFHCDNHKKNSVDQVQFSYLKQ